MSINTTDDELGSEQPAPSLKSEYLRRGIHQLRTKVRNDLGKGFYLYPVIDDTSDAQFWTSGNALCWPRARCLLDKEGDDEGCLRIDLEVIPKMIVTPILPRGSFKEEGEARPILSIPGFATTKSINKSSVTPLESAIDTLFFGRKENPSNNHPSSSTYQASSGTDFQLDIFKTFDHLYEGGDSILIHTREQLLSLQEFQKKHANFINFYGIYEGKNEDDARYVFTKSSEFNLNSLGKFNRHCLRLFGEDSTSGDGSSLTMLTLDMSNNDETAASPSLLGTNPILDGECDIPARFLFFQCLKAVEYLHSVAPHGSLCPEALTVTDDLWIELRPPTWFKMNNKSTSFQEEGEDEEDENLSSRRFGLINATEEWRSGRLSTFEYLLAINQASGRRTGGVGAFHAILPWVRDFENSRARDLTKSKFRLKKGDRQLDMTFIGLDGSSNRISNSRDKKPIAFGGMSTANSSAGGGKATSSSVMPVNISAAAPSHFSSNNGDIPHHIPESISELTYYVYCARISPLRALQKVVRANFEPKEYPATMARVFEWTPDECIPEFFVDPGLFLPNNGLNCLLCGKNQHASESEADVEIGLFLEEHCEQLEEAPVEEIAAWIDLNFGAALQGRTAVENKNVVLISKTRLEPFQVRRSPEFVRVFDRPHPTSKAMTGTETDPYQSPPLTASRMLSSSMISPSSSFRLDRPQSADMTTGAGAQVATSTKGSTAVAVSEKSEDAKREETFLLNVFQAMLAPRDGLRVLIQQQSDVIISPTAASLSTSNASGPGGVDAVDKGMHNTTSGTNVSGAVPPYNTPIMGASQQPQLGSSYPTNPPGGLLMMDNPSAIPVASSTLTTNFTTATTTTTATATTAVIGSATASSGVEPRLTFLGSDLVEWLLRKNIPGVASASDAVALAQKMMAAGFFYPENKDFDDFVDADDVYVFRERKDHIISGGGGGNKRLTGPQLVVSRPFGGSHSADFVDAGVAGLYRIVDYYDYPKNDPRFSLNRRNQDAYALALILAELYLGRPMRDPSELDLLPSPIAQALKLVFLNEDDDDNKNNGEIIRDCWLGNDLNVLFPTYFESVWQFLSRVRLASKESRVEIFVNEAPKLIDSIKDETPNQSFKSEALWLMFPTALRLMKQENAVGKIYSCLKACDDTGAQRSTIHKLVELALASSSPSNYSASTASGEDGPEWAKYLPVEMFLDRFIDAFVASAGRNRSIIRALSLSLGGHLQNKNGIGNNYLLGRAIALVKSRPLNNALAQEMIGKLIDLSNDQQGSSQITNNNQMLSSSRKDHSTATTTTNSSGKNEDESLGGGGGGIYSEEENSEDDDSSHLEMSTVSTSGETLKPSSSIQQQQQRVVPPTTSHFQRSVLSRFCAHADSVITAMASDDGDDDDSNKIFATGTRKGEVAIWSSTSIHSLSVQPGNGGDFEYTELARTSIEGDGIQSIRLLPSRSSSSTSSNRLMMINTSRMGCALFDYARSSIVRTSSWFSTVKCAESVPGHPNLVCMGEISGEVSMIDLRQSRALSRMSIPVVGGSNTPTMIRSVLPTLSHSIYCSSNERLLEMDARVTGRYVREWKAIGKVTRLMEVESPRGAHLLSIIRGGHVASVWDVSSSNGIPRERLRAFAGFDDESESSLTNRETGTMNPFSFIENLDECDSLIAAVDGLDPSQEGPYLYVVRGSSKLARIPLKLHDSPLEVRVRPLSLTNARSNKRYSKGNLSLSAACMLPGQTLAVAGYDTLSFDGSYVHILV